MRDLAEADLSGVTAVFTDVDGTLTTSGKLKSSTVRALERLSDAGIRCVLVSGRPAGWGECWARNLPVDGVIVENGGLYFARRSSGIEKVYIQPEPVRRRNRPRLVQLVKKAMRLVRGARLSADSAYTEVDLAIDYNEEVHLGDGAAEVLERFLRAKGVKAVRSSVHVNCWIGRFDKLSTVRTFLRREWQCELRARDRRFVYAGDSFNDQPMFRAFALSVGVANVRDIADRLDHPPAYVTHAAEGRGFEELAEAILIACKRRRPR